MTGATVVGVDDVGAAVPAVPAAAADWAARASRRVAGVASSARPDEAAVGSSSGVPPRGVAGVVPAWVSGASARRVAGVASRDGRSAAASRDGRSAAGSTAAGCATSAPWSSVRAGSRSASATRPGTPGVPSMRTDLPLDSIVSCCR